MNRAIRIVILAIGAVLGVAVIAPVALLVVLDKEQLGRMTIQAAESAIGRDVRIDGALEMELSLAPRLTAKGVEIGNAPWSSRPVMVVAEALSARIKLLPLLWREIVFDVSLQDAKAIFEVDTDGRRNWMLSPDGSPEPSGEEGWTVKLSRVDITSAAISYRDWGRGLTFDANIDRLSLQRHREREETDLDLAVSRNGLPVEVAGTIRSGTKGTEMELDLRVSSPGAELTLYGELDPGDRERVELELTTKVETVNDIERLLELDLPVQGPVAATARITGEKGVYSVSDINAHLDGSELDLDLNGRMDDLLGTVQLQMGVSGSVASVDDLRLDEGIANHVVRLLPVTGSLTLAGPVSELAALDIDLRSERPGIRLATTGEVQDLGATPRFDLAIAVEADKLSGLSQLGSWVPSKLPDQGPVAASARLQGTTLDFNIEALDAQLSAGELALSVAGAVSGIPSVIDARLDLGMSTPALSNLSSLLGLELPEAGPVELSGRVASGRGSHTLSDLKLRVGSSDMRGELSLDLTDAVTGITAALSSNVLSLQELLGDSTQSSDAQVAEADFPSEPLAFSWLHALEAEIEYDAGVVEAGDYSFEDVSIAASVGGGIIELRSGRAITERGTVSARASFDASGGNLQVSLDGEVDKVPGSALFGLPEGVLTGGETSGSISLSSEGASVAALMNGLSGQGTLRMGPMTISDNALRFVSSDVLTGVLAALNPLAHSDAKKSKGHSYECAVLGFDVKDGVIVSQQGIAFQSKSFNVGGNGTINLGDGKIDITLKPRARKGLGISITSMTGGFRITGTFSDPKIRGSLSGMVETGTVGAAGSAVASAAVAGSAATSAAVAGSAVATAGVALAPVVALGAYGRLTADQFSCESTLERIKRKREGVEDPADGSQAPSSRRDRPSPSLK